jgi:DNA-binding FadR family transcriptional regulator
MPNRAETSLGEHRAIVDAVAGGHPDAAEAAMRAHLESVIGALRQWEHLDQHES